MDFDLLGLAEQPQKQQQLQQQQPKPRQIVKEERLEDAKQRLKKEIVPNFNHLNEHIRGRIEDILDLLLSAADKKMLQSFSRSGLLEETPLLRAHIWKLLLQSLPLQHTRWRDIKQDNYQSYLKLLEGQMHIDHDDLLGMQETENCFDQELWDEIVLDTKRTHSSLNFFQTEVKQIKVYATKPTRHCDILTRILYVWAKVNSGVRYVQGMNEILAPLYYLEFQQIKKESESEIFYMFSSLIAPVIDMHIKDMDKSDHGIMGRMATLNKYLKAVDYELWDKLDRESVNPQFYSFRWLALMLSQEFGLYQTMRIWDILLSYDGQKRLCYLYCLCLGIMKLRKKDIMNTDFGNILPKLHKLKDLEVSQVIEIANRLFQKVVNVDIDKLLQRQEQRREVQTEKANKQLSYTNLYKKTGDMFSKLQNKFSGKK